MNSDCYFFKFRNFTNFKMPQNQDMQQVFITFFKLVKFVNCYKFQNGMSQILIYECNILVW